MSLHPSKGHLVYGFAVNDYQFVGQVSAAQLLLMTTDPRETESISRLAASADTRQLALIRTDVQRAFTGAKAKNVKSYAEYITGLHEGRNGATPPIMLYVAEPLEYEVNEAFLGHILVPWNKHLVAIDGETQLAARFQAAAIAPETRNAIVPVHIYHGRSQEWARQCFYDLNSLAVRPNTALAVSRDTRDPVTNITRTVEDQVPFFKGRVNKTRPYLPVKWEGDVVTFAALRWGCTTLCTGIKGVQYGSRPVPLEAGRLPIYTDAAVIWFTHLSTMIGEAMENRKGTILASTSTFAALGALGHSLVNIENREEQMRAADTLCESIRHVDWSKGRKWDGIAGNITGKSGFTTGPTKSTSHLIFGALTNSSNPAYARIRN